MIETLFKLLFLIVPLIFWPRTSEVFEFNKMLTVYGFTTVIAVDWVVGMIRTKKIIFRRTILDWPLIIFLATQIISTLTSIDVHTSLLGYYSRFNGGLISTICYAFLYWAFVSNIHGKKAFEIVRYLIYSAIGVSLWGVLEHFGHSVSCLFITGHFDVACWVQDVARRVFATLGQPNWMAAFLVALSPLTWKFTVDSFGENDSRRLTDRWYFWAATSLLFFGAILFTKSRSGMLGLAGAFGLFWVWTGWESKRKIKQIVRPFMAIAVGCLVGVVIIGTPWTPSVEEFVSKSESKPEVQQSSGTQLETGGTESGDIRKIVWKGAWDVFGAYPVFGTGPETFAYSYYGFRPQEHNLTSEWDFLYNKAHNEYLNFLANSGAVGTFAYLGLVGFCLYVMRKKPALLAGFVSILITNFFGFSVVAVQVIFFLFPAVAVVGEGSERDKEREKKAKLSIGQNALVLGVVFVGGWILFSILKYFRADLAYNKGQNLFSAQQYTQAIMLLQKATKLSPKEAVYYDKLARAETDLALAAFDIKEEEIGKQLSEKAIGDMNVAADLSPRNVNIKRSQASLYIKLAKVDPNYLVKALDVLAQIKELAPTDPKTYYHLGLTNARLDKIEEGLDFLQKAIDLKPNYQEARTAMGLILIDFDRPEEAREQFEYILKNINPNDKFAQDEIEKLGQ